MKPSTRFIVVTILIVSAFAGSYALWKYHTRQIDRAFDDGMLLGDLQTLYYVSTALGKMSEGDDRNTRKILEMGLSHTLENASDLAASGAKLHVSLPNIPSVLFLTASAVSASTQSCWRRINGL